MISAVRFTDCEFITADDPTDESVGYCHPSAARTKLTPKMDSGGNNLFEYCIGIATEFQSRMNRMRLFVRHNLTSGTANEVILRDFLAKHASGNFGVSQGFICDPTDQNAVSRQCDIIVHHNNTYPPVYSDAGIDVVWPPAVRMVIEVKTSLGRKDLIGALDNVASAVRLNSQIESIVFAFRSPRLTTVMKNLQNCSSSLAIEELPRAILLLDKGVIIHNWGWARERLTDVKTPYSDENFQKPYSVCIAKKDKGAVVVAFLLPLFLQAIQFGKGLHADFINTLNDILEKHTDAINLD
jgi:hypothetical protein